MRCGTGNGRGATCLRYPALAAGTLFAEPLRAAPPSPSAVTPALIEAAQGGQASFYTALELNVAERLGKTFEAKYPGISVRVERSGAERIFQRIAQEQATHLCGRCRQLDRSRALSRLEEEDWLAPYYRTMSRGISRQIRSSGWPACDVLRLAGGNRLQHQPGEAGRRAEELRGSARSQMGG